MPKFEKSMNKFLVGAILGTTILGVAWASMTPKGKSLMGKVKDFIKGWIDELKKNASNDKDAENNDKKTEE
jgi:hypothetical protein